MGHKKKKRYRQSNPKAASTPAALQRRLKAQQPQQTASPQEHPTQKRHFFLGRVLRVPKFVWTFLVVVGLLVGLFLNASKFFPNLPIESEGIVDPAKPTGIPFVVYNDNFYPITNFQPFYYYRSIDYSSGQTLLGTTLGNSKPIPRIGPHEQATFYGQLPHVSMGDILRIDMEVVFDYDIYFVSSLQKRYRYVSMVGTDGMLHLDRQPLLDDSIRVSPLKKANEIWENIHTPNKPKQPPWEVK